MPIPSSTTLTCADHFRYYVWDIEETKPLILVSETQFEQLLKEINSTLGLQLRITNQQREDGLVSRFPDHSRCRPRYLGRSHTRADYDTMVSNVPGAASRLVGEPVPPSLEGRTLEDFKAAMEEMWELTKNKGKAAKEKKMQERMAKQKTFTDQFKRAQRYLGLRPCAQDGKPTTVLHTWLLGSNVLDRPATSPSWPHQRLTSGAFSIRPLCGLCLRRRRVL